MADDYGEHTGYTKEQKLADAELIANAPETLKQRNELLEVLKETKGLIDKEILVRNIDNDHNRSAFIKQGLEIVSVLHKIKKALENPQS